MPSKQSERRQLAKLRAELHAAPWAIDVRALNSLQAAIDGGDLENVQAVLSMGSDEDQSGLRIKNGIAVIPVTGVLRDDVDYMVRFGGATAYQQLERDFNVALEKEDVRAIVFFMNSPGGSAIGCKRIADMVFDSRGLKPIRSYVHTICGSACYYIAAATDRIEANADALVGSVGSIFPHLEQSGMLKDFGVGATVFTNEGSPKKSHGNVFEPLSDDARQTLQQFVNSYGQAFINDVARYRGLTPADVASRYGQGDALRADAAIAQGIVDAIVGGFSEVLDSLSPSGGSPPVSSVVPQRSATMNERIKAQLFALGLISSLDASDEVCNAAMSAWFAARGTALPEDEAARLKSLQTFVIASESADPDSADGDDGEEDDEEEKPESRASRKSLQSAHNAEQLEARLDDLKATAALINKTAGRDVVTAEMILEVATSKMDVRAASALWTAKLSEKEPPVPANRANVTGEGRDVYAEHVVDALVYRAHSDKTRELSNDAAAHVRKPLSRIACECLQMAGRTDVDPYDPPEYIAEQAMAMGNPGERHTFFSQNEGRQYISSGSPFLRPGDFPNILSNLANKYLDTIQLDDDYSYPQVSAVLPGGLNDFKPALMINKGIVEELDELQDAEQLKDLGLSEEVLSYLFLRRFGNRFGWTPVMIANDDMGAFVEGMIGLEEAWQVTQNRLVVDRYTANETLLDSAALFDNRADTGVGSNPAANNNDRTSGGTPSDSEWGAMETLYADIGGIATGRRVRGTLNVAFCPTGSVAQEARRTFLPLNAGGLESKVANTTANVGLYRGEVQVITESELRVSSSAIWYGLRNPTRLNTATVVRAYFNGFGTGGRRERWYDPATKTTYVSIEGRIATAVKNWRYAVRNAGA